jgi:hypothetical protein
MTWTWRKIEPVACGHCGKFELENVRGPRRRWCSESCRLKAYRARRQAEQDFADKP